ncbi:MAG: rhomboid family intramembrane serine protease [Pirellulales bacterium]|nr:rhomboid family intramembrane serine protease [Pirellulales bacterium]
MFPVADENFARRAPLVTWLIIGLNVLVYLLCLRLSEQQLFELHAHRGFVPARIEQLTTRKPLEIPAGEVQVRFGAGFVQHLQPVYLLRADSREIYTSLITSQFLHGGLLHLLGNMLFLYIFGNNVEDRLGHTGFLIFYICGGIVASGFHWAIHSDSLLPTIGASGAVAAVLGAYFVTWPHARVHILVPIFIFPLFFELPAWLVLGFWLAGQILEGIKVLNIDLGGGVAWWAHIGGFIFGAGVLALLNSRQAARSPEKIAPRW